MTRHSSPMILIIIIILANTSSSTAFTPLSLTRSFSGSRKDDDDVFSSVDRHYGLSQLGCLRRRCGNYPSSSLFMNKKKRSQSNSSAKGFGGGDGPVSSTSSTAEAAPGKTINSTTANPTLIQPKLPPPNFKYAGSIRPGYQSPIRSVPSFSSSGKKIIFPDYAVDGKPKARPALFPWIIEVKKPEEIEKMRIAGRVAREVLDLAGRSVEAGITT